MRINVAEDPKDLGRAAALDVSRLITAAIEAHGEARLVVSTGASQFELLDELVRQSVDWSRVTLFHLDEYVGLGAEHPASFRRYLKERLFDHVSIGRAVLVDGDADDVEGVLRDLGRLIRERPVDVGLIGIGQNAHIAFNDPPADFSTRDAYRVVALDAACKHQQVEEGWFATESQVPDFAISMTVHQILQCGAIISAVPHVVKAEAIYRTLTSDESPAVPATALRRHAQWTLYLDRGSASQLDDALRVKLGIKFGS